MPRYSHNHYPSFPPPQEDDPLMRASADELPPSIAERPESSWSQSQLSVPSTSSSGGGGYNRWSQASNLSYESSPSDLESNPDPNSFYFASRPRPGPSPLASNQSIPRSTTRRHHPNSVSIDSRASSESRYPLLRASTSEKFLDASHPSLWEESAPGFGGDADDYLHEPDPIRDRYKIERSPIWTLRGLQNLGFLLVLSIGLIGLFAGYPVISDLLAKQPSKLGAHNIGGINGSGQVPELSGRFALVDPDTPSSAMYYTTHNGGKKWQLMFSDEFNVDGRSFYPGDDPYWEAGDFHYWATGDMEYYDPSAISTRDGSLIIQLSQEENHGLDYKSGHLTSWNKLCLTGGYVEVNVSLPGPPSLAGFWPAVWMMGNLGRAGYGATTEGLWPYSYDTCDWGTLPGQVFPSPTDPNAQPSAALTTGPGGGVLSGAPGQRFSACTCGNANDGDGPMGHPGPKRGDGFVGRMAPEIDILEASSFNGIGTVSQSLQVAPFNAAYNWSQDSSDLSIYDSTTILNSYKGGVYQESISAVSDTNQNGYESTGGYSTFGIEYEPGSDGYITWFSNGSPTWTVYPSAFGPDSQTNISQRLVSPEPMYLIMNLGYSHGFGAISPNLPFPATMSIDYIRIYQNPSNSQNTQLSCNPPGYPTEQYINDYIQIYTDPNITSFSGTQVGSFGATVPKNKLIDTC